MMRVIYENSSSKVELSLEGDVYEISQETNEGEGLGAIYLYEHELEALVNAFNEMRTIE